jgi:hypothetical protein
MLLSLLRRCFTDVALVHEDEFDCLASQLLHSFSKLTNLCTILLIGGRQMPRQQGAQRIHRCVHLATFASLSPVIARTTSTSRCRLQGPAIQDGSRGLPAAPFGFPRASNADCRRWHQSSLPPTERSRLLIDDIPGRQVIGHHPPRSTYSCDQAQAIHYFAQAVGALPGIFGQQRQVGSDKGLFVLAHISRVRGLWSCHPPFYHLLDV